MKRLLLLRLPLIALMISLLGTFGSATAGAAAPRGFLGISPQTMLSQEELDQMTQARITTMRLPLYWSSVERRNPAFAERDWSVFDTQVEDAARAGIEVFPFIWATPRWVARHPEAEPVATATARRSWSAFLRASARRYGPGGTFGRKRPELPRLPIRRWQIWNEPNIITFSRDPDPERYALLVKTSARALHRVNPGAEIILAGVFGGVDHAPPNVLPVDFVAEVYEQPQMERYIDGIALHPYLSHAREIEPIAQGLREVLRSNGVGETPFWVTEMGWGSDGGESRWERGWRGQARELNRAMGMLVRRRRSWRVAGVYWFTWRDLSPACLFCDSAGLFTDEGDPKPSWYAFNFWTGGDPRLR